MSLLPADVNAKLAHVGVIIPTLNAVPYFSELLPALSRQGLSPNQYLVIDSSSEDGTVRLAREFGARVETIARRDFNHGGTRRHAVTAMSQYDVLVFLTQDAVPASADAVSHLVTPFSDPAVGMSYGRQLPRPTAKAVERHARYYNYAEQSEVRSFEDRHRFGIKTVFCSNSFAAYRRSALEAVGSFPQDALFAEDQIVSGRMLMANWKLAYCADAQVTHSHGYSLAEEFRRYFDVGVFHGRNAWLLAAFGKVEGEGFHFLRAQMEYLLKHEPLSIPSAFMRTGAKYLAYKIGQREAKLPLKWKRRLSMQPSYWCKTPI